MVTKIINGLQVLQSEQLLKVGVQHGWFGADLGDTILRPETSKEEAKLIKQRWQTACRAIGVKVERLATTHGLLNTDIIIEVNEPQAGQPVGPADGYVTTGRGIPLLLRAADCMLIVMHGLSQAGQPVLAAVHAGGKGTALGIVFKMVRLLQDQYGVDPAGLLASIGPAIAPQHFVPSPDTLELTAGGIPKLRTVQLSGGRVGLDTAGSATDQLLAAGLRQSHIDTSTIDTFSDQGWFSLRRDRQRDPAAARRRHGLFVSLSA